MSGSSSETTPTTATQTPPASAAPPEDPFSFPTHGVKNRPAPSWVLSGAQSQCNAHKTRVHTRAVASEHTHKATSWCKARSHDPFSTCLPDAFFFFFKCLPGGSDGKESTCNAADLGSIPGLGRRAWQPTTPIFLPGESPWTEEPGGLHSMQSQSRTRLSN